jgi:tetratricopeptide (TPR) repeat protein
MSETTMARMIQATANDADLTWVRDKHRDYYVALSQRGEGGLRGPQAADWLHILETEQDNFRAALQWSIDRGAAEEALTMAAALAPFWSTRGLIAEAVLWLDRALALEEARGSRAGVRAMVQAARFAGSHSTEDRRESEVLAVQAVEAARAANDRAQECAALTVRARNHEWLAPGTARSLGEEAVAIARELGDERALADALATLGRVLGFRGQHGRGAGRPALEEALTIQRRTGDKVGMVETLLGLGRAEESLEICRELGLGVPTIWALDSIAYEATRRHGIPTARAARDEALEVARIYADTGTLTTCLTSSGITAACAGDTSLALQLFKEAVEIGRDSAIPGVHRWALQEWVAVALEAGMVDEAAAAHQELIGLIDRGVLVRPQGLGASALYYLHRGDGPAAREAVEEALDLYRAMGSRERLDRWGRIRGEALVLEGDLDGARDVFESLNGWESRPDVLMDHGGVAVMGGDVEKANDLYHQALVRSGETVPRPRLSLIGAIEGVARVAIAEGDSARAARLFGAAEGVRNRFGIARMWWWPCQDTLFDRREDYERDLAVLRTALGAGFDNAWDEGRAMSDEQAKDLAAN